MLTQLEVEDRTAPETWDNPARDRYPADLRRATGSRSFEGLLLGRVRQVFRALPDLD